MNKKEIAEIKRRTTAAKTTASAIFGCFVSASREQISSFSVPTLDMDEQEGNQYFGIFKKILAPQLGAKSFNLEMDVNFVANSEEHKLLMALRKSRMKDGGLRAALYDKIIENVTMEQNYLILVDFETYDVPNKQDAEQSDEVFSYFLVAICPVKQSKAELSYITSSKDFHNKSNGQVSGSPLYGFMFPAFNERVTDINSALFFANKTENGSADRLAKALFGCELPAGEETTREKFTGVMRTALGDECGMEVVRQLQSELALMTEASEADAERGQEPLKLDIQDLTRILEQKCGMEQHQSELFATAFDEAFGKDAEMEPKNMMELVKYKVSTPNVSISLKREAAHDVQMRTIDGIPYILVRRTERYPARPRPGRNGTAVRRLLEIVLDALICAFSLLGIILVHDVASGLEETISTVAFVVSAILLATLAIYTAREVWVLLTSSEPKTEHKRTKRRPAGSRRRKRGVV